MAHFFCVRELTSFGSPPGKYKTHGIDLEQIGIFKLFIEATTGVRCMLMQGTHKPATSKAGHVIQSKRQKRKKWRNEYKIQSK